MYYRNFEIENYKGIKEIKVDLSNNRILTFVGLNESGKTTILASINWFYKLIKGYVPTEQEINSFRPKGIAFTGIVEMCSELRYCNTVAKSSVYGKPAEFVPLRNLIHISIHLRTTCINAHSES